MPTGLSDGDTNCNNADDDCNGQTDDGYSALDTACGKGICAAAGKTSCVAGQVQDSCAALPSEASDTNCNNLDDDCNGKTDDGYLALDTACGKGICAAKGKTSCLAGKLQDSCVDDSLGIRCFCDPGYGPGGALSCVPAGQCSKGFVRAAGQCVALASLTQWCGDYCVSLGLACPKSAALPATCQDFCATAKASGSGCIAQCLGELDQPGAAAQTICGGLMRRMDAIDCRELANCGKALAPPECVPLCDQAHACGLLGDSRLLLGGSREECVLQCNALASALTPRMRFEPLTRCLALAMETCDPLRVLGCTVVGVADLESKLCAMAAKDCQSVPGVWTNEADCKAAVKGWGAGPHIAAGGCLEIGGNSAKCGKNQCAIPPTSLPKGAAAAAAAMVGHCPQLLAVPADHPMVGEFYGWLYVAVLKAFGKPIDRNYALISDCFLSSPCPPTREGTLQCLLNTPKE